MSATTLPATPIPVPDHSSAIRSSSRGVKRFRPGRMLVHVIVFIACAVWFTPVLQLVAASLRTNPDTASSGWWNIFTHPLITLDNFSSAASVMSLGTTIPATLSMTIPAVILTVLISAYGGFALSRWHFRGRSAVYAILVALMVVPPQVTLAPLVQLFSHIGLTGTPAAVWIWQAGFTLPFGVFLMRGYMASLPGELLEAATMDGASDFRTFFQVILPLSVPLLASLGILQFLWSWNDLLTPLIFIGPASGAAPVTLQLSNMLQSTSGGSTNLLSAGALIAVVVPLIVIIALQRYFVAGITGGAVKG